MKEALNLLSNVVHQFQKERGSACLFLGSDGKRFEKHLAQQFLETDRSLSLLEKTHKQWSAEGLFKASLQTKLEELLGKKEILAKERLSIQNLKTKSSGIINTYTHEIITPLLNLMIEVALFDEDNDPTKVSAYANFLQWKERVGRERAIGLRGFLTASFDSKEFIEHLQFLISEQESYERTFLALVDEGQKLCLQKQFQGKVLQEVEQIHKSLENTGKATPIRKLTAESWFELMTRKIDLMRQVEMLLVDTLNKNEQRQTNIAAADISAAQNGISKEYREFVHRLPLFSGLSEKLFSELLKHAQIREYNKGKLLFLEGEQATRLYIVLSGWVKLFKGTAGGEEAILQMLSSGDTLAESAVFLNMPFPVSAQIAETAKIMTLPAPIIREQIRNSNELAVGMLTSMSQRSHYLIQQIERTRLKSAEERVGWFLLKMLLEQDRIPDAVTLPYDKSLIASYLDMKPETFSRTLKQFKDRGFRIENDMIILPNIASLCDFCDTATSALCKRHGTPACPNPHCGEEEKKQKKAAI